MCDVLPWKDVRTNDRMEDDLPPTLNQRRALARFGRALTRTTQAALTLALKPFRTIAGVLAEQRIHQVAVRLTTRR